MNLNINSNPLGQQNYELANMAKSSPAKPSVANIEAEKDSPTLSKVSSQYVQVHEGYKDSLSVDSQKVDAAKEALANWQSPQDSEVDSIFADMFG